MVGRGGYASVLQKTMGSLQDPSALSSIGYIAVEDIKGASAADYERQQWLAERHFGLVLHLCKERACRTSLYSESLPGRFARLLDPSLNQAQELAEFRRWWSALCLAEALALRRQAWRRHINQCLWPLHAFVRECMVELYEVDFMTVPPGLADRIRKMCQMPLRTKTVEDSFNVLRNKEGGNQRGVLGRLARWCGASGSTLLEDADWPAPPVTTAARAIAGKTVPPATFECRDAGRFALGPDMLKSMSIDPPAWPSPSPGS